MCYKVHSVQSLSDIHACSIHTESWLAHVRVCQASPNSIAAPESTWSAVPHNSSKPLSISKRAGSLEISWRACWLRARSGEVSQWRMWWKSTRSCLPEDDLGVHKHKEDVAVNLAATQVVVVVPSKTKNLCSYCFLLLLRLFYFVLGEGGSGGGGRWVDMALLQIAITSTKFVAPQTLFTSF